jgi:hypothetical protein
MRGDFELARLRSNHLVDELTLTEVSAFDAMNAFFIARPPVRDELIEIAFNSDGTLKDWQIAAYGRLMQHYAQAAPKGSTRVSASSTDEDVRVVAFQRTDGVALVAVNNGARDLKIKLNVPARMAWVSRENSLWQRARPTRFRPRAW